MGYVECSPFVVAKRQPLGIALAKVGKALLAASGCEAARLGELLGTALNADDAAAGKHAQGNGPRQLSQARTDIDAPLAPGQRHFVDRHVVQELVQARQASLLV